MAGLYCCPFEPGADDGASIATCPTARPKAKQAEKKPDKKTDKKKAKPAKKAAGDPRCKKAFPDMGAAHASPVTAAQDNDPNVERMSRNAGCRELPGKPRLLCCPD